jgi:hypothetical protein
MRAARFLIPSVLASTFALAQSALAAPEVASTSSAHAFSTYDPLGLGIDLRTTCDLREGSAMTESCRGFIGAILYIEREYVFYPDNIRRAMNPACISPKTTILEAWTAIRPWLRPHVGICAGFCTPTSYVRAALNAMYPCPPAR